MTKQAKMYRWTPNAKTHSIAITKFSVFSMIYSIFVGALVGLGMGMSNDGTRDFVVLTAALILTAVIISFIVILSSMTIMYAWVVEENAKEAPSKQITEKHIWTEKGGGVWIKERKKDGGAG